MEHQGSLTHSQQSATYPYPEPDQSSPCSPSHFLKIQLNIMLPSTPGSSKWSLSLRFPTKPLYASLSTFYMPRPSHSSRFGQLNNIWWGVQIIKLLYLYFSRYFVPLRPKYSPQHPILKHPQPTFFPQRAAIRTTIRWILFTSPACSWFFHARHCVFRLLVFQPFPRKTPVLTASQALVLRHASPSSKADWVSVWQRALMQFVLALTLRSLCHKHICRATNRSAT